MRQNGEQCYQKYQNCKRTNKNDYENTFEKHTFFFFALLLITPPKKNLSLYSSILKGTYTDQIEPTGLRFGHNVTSEKLTGRYGSAVLVQLDPILYCSPLCNSDWGLWGFSQILSCIMLTVESDSSGIKKHKHLLEKTGKPVEIRLANCSIIHASLILPEVVQWKKGDNKSCCLSSANIYVSILHQKKSIPHPHTPPSPVSSFSLSWLHFGCRISHLRVTVDARKYVKSVENVRHGPRSREQHDHGSGRPQPGGLMLLDEWLCHGRRAWRFLSFYRLRSNPSLCVHQFSISHTPLSVWRWFMQDAASDLYKGSAVVHQHQRLHRPTLCPFVLCILATSFWVDYRLIHPNRLTFYTMMSLNECLCPAAVVGFSWGHWDTGAQRSTWTKGTTLSFLKLPPSSSPSY